MAFGDVVQSNGGTGAASSTFSPTLGSAITAGNLVVLMVTANNVPSGANTGWTKSTGMSPVANAQGLLWWFVGTAGQAIPSVTFAGASTYAWRIAEYEGPFNALTANTSNGAATNGTLVSPATITTTSITPTAGSDYLLVGGLGVQYGNASGNVAGITLGSFTNSFGNATQQFRQAATEAQIACQVSRVVTSASGSYSTAGNASVVGTSGADCAIGMTIAFLKQVIGLPFTLTGISTAVAPVGPFKVLAGDYQVSMVDTAVAPVGAFNLTGAGTTVGLGQSFTNGSSAFNASSVYVAMFKTGTPTGTMYAEITSTDPTGSVLATSANVNCSDITATTFGTATFIPFIFASPPTIGASATFGVRVRRSVSDAVNYPSMMLGGPYTGGTTWGYNGTTWSATSNDFRIIVNKTVNVASDRYYFFGVDGTTATTLQAYKSTAVDTSWLSIATKTGFATGVQFISACQDGATIHMVITDGATTSINHKYQTFDATSDTFVTAETINSALNTQTSASANAYNTSVVVRDSAKEVVVYYHAARISTFAQTAYRRRTTVNTWSTAVAVSATGTNCTNPIVVRGASDRLHFLHFNATNTIQRHLTSANVLGTAASTGATALPQDINTRNDSGTIRHVGFTAASAFRWASADNPTVTNAAVTLGTPARTIDDNAIVWALYQNSADSDLYVKSSSDSGATFGTAVSALVGTVASADANLSKNQTVYARGTNYVFPYVVNDNGTLKYNEYVVRSAGLTNPTMAAGTGTIALSGQTAVLNTALPVTTGTLTPAGQTAELRIARKTAAGLGTLTLAGQNVALTKTTAATHRTMPADTGTLTPAGQAVTLRYARKMSAGLGTITLAGQTATLKRNYVMPATLGTITLAGAAPNLIYSGAGSKSMPAGLGVVTLAGQTVTVRYAHKLIAGTGTLTLAGQTAGLRASHLPLAAGLGTLTLSGQLVTTRFAHRTVAGLGTLTLAGQTAIVRYARKMPAGQGTLTPSGQNVTLRYSRKMPAGLGTITLAGPVVNTIYSGSGNKLLPAGLGILTPAGQAVTLRYARKMPAGLGTITLAGQAVALQRARKVTVDVGSIVLEGKATGLIYGEKVRYVLTAATGVLSLTGCDVTMPITRRPPTIVQENLKFGRSVYVSRW